MPPSVSTPSTSVRTSRIAPGLAKDDRASRVVAETAGLARADHRDKADQVADGQHVYDPQQVADHRVARRHRQTALAHDPNGCFVLDDSGERIGLATTTCHTRTAWIGNVIVVPDHREVAERLPFENRGSATRATLARGGFSTVWGAAVLPYLAEDLDEWPISLADLEPHYRAVTRLIDLSATHVVINGQTILRMTSANSI